MVHRFCGKPKFLTRSALVVTCLLTIVYGTGCNGLDGLRSPSYVTPGRGAALPTLTETDIAELMSRQPASQFPARIMITRVQDAVYQHYTTTKRSGYDRYSVVTTRDIEENEHFERLSKMPNVLSVATMNRMLLPARLKSLKDLRQAAARVQADLLLAYTIDTVFHVQDHDIGPLGLISLGFIKNQEAHVTATASALICDVRTGFVYGLTEATDRQDQMASHWNSHEAVDQSRRIAEREALNQLLDKLENLWGGIVAEHAHVSTTQGQSG